MADLFLSLTMVGETGPLPAPVPRGQVRTLRIAATDGPGGAAVAATGVAVEVRSPSGATVYSGSDLAAGTTGVWTLAVTLGARGAWVAQASASGPQAARSADLPIHVLGSAADAPVPAPPAPAVVDAEQSAAEAAQSAVDSAAAAVEAAGSAAEAEAAAAANLLLRNFDTWANAVTAITLGGISASVFTLYVHGHSAIGDGGHSRWVYRTSVPEHSMRIADPVRGGAWELEQRIVRPEVAGGFGVLIGEPTVDAQPAVQALLDYLEDIGGGTLDYSGGRYLIEADDLVAPGNVLLTCGWAGPMRSSAGAQNDQGLVGNLGTMPALVLDTAITIYPKQGAHIARNVFLRRGLQQVLSYQDYQDHVRNADAGTALSLIGSNADNIHGRDLLIESNVFVGFEYGVLSDGGGVRTVIRHNFADCTNCYVIHNSGAEVTLEENNGSALRGSVVLPNETRNIVSFQKITKAAPWKDANKIDRAAGDYVGITLASDIFKSVTRTQNTQRATITTTPGNILPSGSSNRELIEESADGRNFTLNVPWIAAYDTSLVAATGTMTRSPARGGLLYDCATFANNGSGKTRVTMDLPAGSELGGILRVNDWVVLQDVPRSLADTYAGEYKVLARPDAVTIDLDLAWDAALAALAGRARLAVMPLRRHGTFIELINVDGSKLIGNTCKGPVKGYHIDAANCAGFGNSFEPGAAGPTLGADQSTVALHVGADAARFSWTGGALKSAGTTILWEQTHHEGGTLSNLQIFSGYLRTIDVREGRVRAKGVVVKGTPVVRMADTARRVFITGGYWVGLQAEVDAGSVLNPWDRILSPGLDANKSNSAASRKWTGYGPFELLARDTTAAVVKDILGFADNGGNARVTVSSGFGVLLAAGSEVELSGLLSYTPAYDDDDPTPDPVDPNGVYTVVSVDDGATGAVLTIDLAYDAELVGQTGQCSSVLGSWRPVVASHTDRAPITGPRSSSAGGAYYAYAPDGTTVRALEATADGWVAGAASGGAVTVGALAHGFTVTNFSASESTTQAHGGTIRRAQGGAGLTVTLTDLAIGTQIIYIQSGGGAVTFAPAPGVTISSLGGLLTTGGQGSLVFATKTAGGTWNLSGDLAAAAVTPTRYQYSATTTDATPTSLTSSTPLLLTVNERSAVFDLRVKAKRTTGTPTERLQAAAWGLSTLLLTRVTAASSTTLDGGGAAIAPTRNPAAVAWTLAVTADTLSGGMSLTATGAAATIEWDATVELLAGP